MAPGTSKLFCTLAKVVEKSDALQPCTDLLEDRGVHMGDVETRLPLRTQPSARFFLAAGTQSLLKTDAYPHGSYLRGYGVFRTAMQFPNAMWNMAACHVNGLHLC